jgi:hypothetical protein
MRRHPVVLLMTELLSPTQSLFENGSTALFLFILKVIVLHFVYVPNLVVIHLIQPIFD